MTEEKSDTLKENAADLQESYHSLPVGEILKRERLRHGLSSEQVQAQLRIKALYLEAIEKSDFERIPGQAYVVGYVRSYADYLGLDSVKLIQLLKKQSGPQVEKPKQIFPVVSDEQKIPSKKIIAISTAALIVILLVWQVTGSSSQTSDDVPPVPKDLTEQMTVPEKPPEETQAAASTAVEEAKPKPHPVVLKATQDVWVEIRDGEGKPVFSRVLKGGEEYWVPPDQVGFTMTTGNAGGLQPVVEGQLLPHLGKAGEVQRKVSLNPWDLKGVPAPVAGPDMVPTKAPEAVFVPLAPSLPESSTTQTPAQ